MRIGLVTGEFPPLQGGVGAFTQELARALAAAGHEIHVISGRGARPQPPREERFSLRRLRQPFDLRFATLHPRGRRWGWGDVNMIAGVALRYNLDVLNIQYQAAAYNMRSAAVNLAPWRLKGLATTVVTYHDLRVPYLFPKAGPLRRLAVRFMARQAHGAIATNGDDLRTLQAWDIPPHRLRQIPIGSNVAVHPASEEERLLVRRKLGVRPADCLLGYFGFLNESKGADVLVRALAQLGDGFHLVFIGGRTGASDNANNQGFLDRLDDQIAAAGVGERVHWTGFLPDEAVSAHLHAADMMVMPYRDGVSLRRGTLMAALAHGRPIISTAPATAAPPLQHGENVWLVPREDAGALADAIQTLAARPDLRAELGSAAARVSDLFTWERIAAQTADFFAALDRER